MGLVSAKAVVLRMASVETVETVRMVVFILSFGILKMVIVFKVIDGV